MWHCFLATVSVGLLFSSTAFAENWPNWRGPQNNGLSGEENLPVKFGPKQNLAWKVALPGPAGSTPVVWENHIFLTSVDADGQLLLLCYDTQGKKLWQKVVGVGNSTARGDEGNSASPSPVTNGEYVWSFMGNGMLACYDFTGKEIWKFDVQDRYGKFIIQFGMSSTPVYFEGKLYLQLIHGEGKAETREAAIVALDGKTGREIWKTGRPSDGYAENEHSYASPIIYDDGDLRFLLTHGADYLVAHNLMTGQEIWRCGGLNPKENYDPTLRFVASPSWVPGLIVVPSAKKGPVVALKPNGKGNITGNPEFQLWRHDRTPDVPSPLIVGDIVYLCMQDGNLQALEAESGKELYFERTHRQRHRASPVYADGHIYLTARDGRVNVVAAGPTFKLVAENDLGEDMSSSPVISNGTLYMRSFGHLWAFRNSKEATGK